MSDEASNVPVPEPAAAPAEMSSPPPAAMPPREGDDPKARLRALAAKASQTRSRAALLEYLRLRRTLR